MSKEKRDKLKNILIFLMVFRWIWFVFVEHITASNDYFAGALSDLNVSFIGRFAHSFAVFEFLATLWTPFWTLLFYIPILWGIYALVIKAGHFLSEDVAQISRKERIVAKIRVFLWELVIIRWAFFALSHIMEMPPNIIAFLDWLKSIFKLEDGGAVISILSVIWFALLFVIPVILLFVRYRFVSRDVPYVFRKQLGRVGGLIENSPKIGNEKADHFILHTIDLQSFEEKLIDLRNSPVYSLSDRCVLKLENASGSYDAALYRAVNDSAAGTLPLLTAGPDQKADGADSCLDENWTLETYLTFGMWMEVDNVRIKIERVRI